MDVCKAQRVQAFPTLRFLKNGEPVTGADYRYPTPNPQPPIPTLNPQPSTLNPQPSTLNPQPSTLNPQPSTLNPQPSTLNPQPVPQVGPYHVSVDGFREAEARA